MKRSANPYLGRIVSLVQERDTTRAVEVFVKSRRALADSLETIAHNLGVDEIMEERLPFDGGLFRENGRVIIKLNCDSPEVRKKFTLAHEIGHLFLETIPGRKSNGHSDVALERTCDIIAAELLMPAEEAIPFVRSLGTPCPVKLREIASRYGVSHQFAAIRVHYDFRLWKCCAGLWELQSVTQSKWFVGDRRWDIAQPDTYSLELAIDSAKPVKTTELWPRGGFMDQVWLNLLDIGKNTQTGSNRILGLVGFVQ